ncbi:MAG TPA: hypothetical protein DD670_11400 [Planctomycetaceae bacterium]|nr:hypothetical protein [Planctomycetaceae bacterium]
MGESHFPEEYARLRSQIGADEAVGIAARWWRLFEARHLSSRPTMVVELAHDLLKRGMNVTALFVACVCANTDRISAALAWRDQNEARRGSLFRSGDFCFFCGKYRMVRLEEATEVGNQSRTEVEFSVDESEVELHTGDKYPLFKGAVCYWRLAVE